MIVEFLISLKPLKSLCSETNYSFIRLQMHKVHVCISHTMYCNELQSNILSKAAKSQLSLWKIYSTFGHKSEWKLWKSLIQTPHVLWAAANPTWVNGAMLIQQIQPVNSRDRQMADHAAPILRCPLLPRNECSLEDLGNCLMRRLSTVQEPGL